MTQKQVYCRLEIETIKEAKKYCIDADMAFNTFMNIAIKNELERVLNNNKC